MKSQRCLVAFALLAGIAQVVYGQSPIEPPFNRHTGKPMAAENVAELAEECVSDCSEHEVEEALDEDTQESDEENNNWFEVGGISISW